MKLEADKLAKRKQNSPIPFINGGVTGVKNGGPPDASAVAVGDNVHLQIKNLPELRNAFLVKIIEINDNNYMGKIIQRSIIPEKVLPPEQTRINFEKENIMCVIR